MANTTHRLLAFCACALILNTSAHGIVTGITTVNDDNVTLESVTMDRGGASYTYNVSQLIGVDVTAYEGNPGSSQIVTNGAGSSVPPIGDRATLLEDNLLTTGLINPARSALGDTVSIDFALPIVNSFGSDIILFEFGSDANQGDPFVVAINGVVNTITFDTQIYPAGITDKQVHSSTSGTVSTLTQLENDTFNAGSVAVGGLYAYSLDLTDFDVAFGDTITSMSFSSSSIGSDLTVDPVFIAGTIPEPSLFASLVGLMSLLVVAARRRTCR